MGALTHSAASATSTASPKRRHGLAQSKTWRSRVAPSSKRQRLEPRQTREGKAKTRQRRIVKLSENAIAWLTDYAVKRPALTFSNFQRLFARVKNPAGFNSKQGAKGLRPWIPATCVKALCHPAASRFQAPSVSKSRSPVVPKSCSLVLPPPLQSPRERNRRQRVLADHARDCEKPNCQTPRPSRHRLIGSDPAGKSNPL